ncbi:conserved hypothetical protein [Vibrio chagasii]|nr:conserved hypothetical protein [Vibrio chagasii]CAH6910966.1 conserved hypothetical protein [Vibrio chagasii]CAH7092050.1 conserved hypothetical protein [Vibrio chagasii]CAH7220884.1 conserved hypothetical protein [Vibrio chagasii]CAH7445787.1 conserved hypothetical protein [Vibrio chagasii]
MEVSSVVSILAMIAACLSALYARWSANQAKRANDIGRLNALLAMKEHYLKLIEHQYKIADTLQSSSNGMQSVRDRVGELDGKLREVNEQISCYHVKVIENKI